MNLENGDPSAPLLSWTGAEMVTRTEGWSLVSLPGGHDQIWGQVGGQFVAHQLDFDKVIAEEIPPH